MIQKPKANAVIRIRFCFSAQINILHIYVKILYLFLTYYVIYYK